MPMVAIEQDSRSLSCWRRVWRLVSAGPRCEIMRPFGRLADPARAAMALVSAKDDTLRDEDLMGLARPCTWGRGVRPHEGMHEALRGGIRPQTVGSCLATCRSLEQGRARRAQLGRDRAMLAVLPH